MTQIEIIREIINNGIVDEVYETLRIYREKETFLLKCNNPLHFG